MQTMKSRLATTLLVAALIAPAFAYAADTKSTKETVKEAVDDSVITTKIKAEYAKDKDVSAMSIKVDTDAKGIVTLSGNAKEQGGSRQGG
jgi:osmotically-inducible protein OsmY